MGDVDILLVFILSHGEQNSIVCRDHSRVKINPTILDIFSDKNCPGLRGKPKLFFFQACQVHGVLGTAASSTGASGDRPKSSDEDLKHHDVLLAFSSYSGDKSYRWERYGAWFIRALIYELATHAASDDIMEILRSVNHIVSHLKTEDQRIQLPMTRKSLTKRCYIMPPP